MKVFAKAIVIIGIIIFFLFIWAFLLMSRQNSGHITPGPIGLILLIGLIAAIRAVIKYKPQQDNTANKTVTKSERTKKSPTELDKYQLKKD